MREGEDNHNMIYSSFNARSAVTSYLLTFYSQWNVKTSPIYIFRERVLFLVLIVFSWFFSILLAYFPDMKKRQ
ncbi:hypothetical protein XELAEV_18015621mg [Xenopus laevis]|uniref:Uncharacterized protein n=1 Tax=Xenopus laevis TaxID=8355 RepID=A0A974DIC5_XENLA|nr:hypothetical protein XELAEV_18015621mg [Xenopus laevis]